MISFFDLKGLTISRQSLDHRALFFLFFFSIIISNKPDESTTYATMVSTDLEIDRCKRWWRIRYWACPTINCFKSSW